MALSSTIYTISSGEVGDSAWDLVYEGRVEHAPGYLDASHIFMYINDIQVTVGGGGTEYGGSGITFAFVTLVAYRVVRLYHFKD